MMKFKILLGITLFFCSGILSAQLHFEKEYRIRKIQFPEKAISLVQENISNYKKVKYYKEIDSNITYFNLKLKKDKLWYSLNFTEDGNLKNIALQIKSIAILDESYEKIKTYLNETYSSFKVKKIEQLYIVDGNVPKTFKTAFQNLITPKIKYKFTVRAKQGTNGSVGFDILFNADGKCISSKKSLPPNYDHVLY